MCEIKYLYVLKISYLFWHKIKDKKEELINAIKYIFLISYIYNILLIYIYNIHFNMSYVLSIKLFVKILFLNCSQFFSQEISQNLLISLLQTSKRKKRSDIKARVAILRNIIPTLFPFL